MRDLQPFETVLQRQELTETEFLSLKNELSELRREFAQKTGVHHPKVDLKDLQKIEQKICSIEHTLAHTSIVRDPQVEPDYFDYSSTVKSIITEIRLSAMGLWMSVKQKVRPAKHGYTHHTTTYHVKR